MTARAEDRWALRVWDVDDGLPRNTIISMSQTADGFLWLTTTSHLLRFDGATFVNIPGSHLGIGRPDSPNRIFPSAEGGLWVRFRRQAPLKVAQGRGLLMDARLPASGVRWLVDHPEEFWVNYDNGEAYRLRGGNVTQFGANSGLSGGTQSFIRDAGGQVWYARRGQIGRLQGEQFERVFEESGATSRLAPASDDGVWAAIGPRLTRIYADGRIEERGRYTTEAGDPAPSVVMEDRQGAVWIGTRDRGLFRMDAHGVEAVPTSHREILSLMQDRTGNIWVGTDGGGLNRLQPRAISLMGDDAQLSPFDTLSSICQDTEGRIWATTQNNILAVLGPAGWSDVSSQAGWPGGAPSCVAADSSGGIWIGTRNDGLIRLKDGRYTTYGEEQGLRSRAIDTLLVARNGDVWIGGRRLDCVHRLRDGRFQLMTKQEDVRTLHAMVEDAAGDVWAGTSRGVLLRFRGDEVIDESARLGDPSAIHALAADESGLWIGFGSGLGRLKNGRFAKITPASGLYDSYLSQIMPDHSGWMWISSSRGVFKVKMQDVDDVVEGRMSSIHSYRYGRDAGLSRLEGVHGVWPNVVRTTDGRIWMPLQSSVAVIDPRKLPPEEDSPLIYIQEVRVDDKVRAFYGGAAPTRDVVNLSLPQAELTLGPTHRRLEIVFGGLDLGAADNLRFRTQLEGYEPDWNEAGVNREVVYSRLPAGQYRFRVSARTSDGAWTETQTVLSIRVTPFFWETWWFRLCALAIFTGLVIAGVRYVSFRRLKTSLRQAREQAALAQERARIARDIHDDVGNQLTEILLIADRSRRRPPEMAAKSLEDITGTTHRIIKSLEEIVWAINPANDTLANLIGYIAQFASNFLRLAEIRCVLDLPVEVPDRILPTNVRHHLFLVAKEALHNAVQHAQASEVTVRVTLTAQMLMIAVGDNGSGLPENAAGPGSDGLRNMPQRMAAIGGSLEMQSTPGGGTCVILRYPLLPVAPLRAPV